MYRGTNDHLSGDDEIPEPPSVVGLPEPPYTGLRAPPQVVLPPCWSVWIRFIDWVSDEAKYSLRNCLVSPQLQSVKLLNVY